MRLPHKDFQNKLRQLFIRSRAAQRMHRAQGGPRALDAQPRATPGRKLKKPTTSNRPQMRIQPHAVAPVRIESTEAADLAPGDVVPGGVPPSDVVPDGAASSDRLNSVPGAAKSVAPGDVTDDGVAGEPR